MTATLEIYFAQPNTPSADSPVGTLMARLLEKNPGMALGEAKAEAHNLLDRAAKSKNYKFPIVLSPEEKAEAAARLREMFKKTA